MLDQLQEELTASREKSKAELGNDGLEKYYR